jgi:hypothetical protein
MDRLIQKMVFLSTLYLSNQTKSGLAHTPTLSARQSVRGSHVARDGLGVLPFLAGGQGGREGGSSRVKS